MLDEWHAGRYNKSMPPTSTQQRRKNRRVPERSLGTALVWSLLTVLALSLVVFEIDLRWPNSPLNNLWSLLIINGQVNPSNPLVVRLVGEIVQQDLAFFSYMILLGGGIALGWLAPRSATQIRVLLAAGGATIGIVAVCLALAWSMQIWMQSGKLMPHQIDALLVLTQLGWAVSWVFVYMGGSMIGLRLRNRQRKAVPASYQPETSRPVKMRP